jgi:class 3 adenylate cyclase
VQVSQATYELIKDDFTCVSRGRIAVKGRGEMETWILVDEVRTENLGG